MSSCLRQEKFKKSATHSTFPSEIMDKPATAETGGKSYACHKKDGSITIYPKIEDTKPREIGDVQLIILDSVKLLCARYRFLT